MRDIREYLLQRRIGIAGRYFEAIARFEEQLHTLHESHRKLMADISSERGAVDTMLAIENNRPSNGQGAEREITSTLLKNLSEIIQRHQ